MGRTKRVATVPETVYLDYSTAKLAELRVSAQDLAGAVARRNAVVPGGTYRTEGSTFPVQVTGEFGNERELLDTVVSTASDGTPIYLRDAATVEKASRPAIRRRGNGLVMESDPDRRKYRPVAARYC